MFTVFYVARHKGKRYVNFFFNVYSQFRVVYGSSDYLKFKQVFFLFIYLRIFSYIVSRPNHIKISIRETSE